MPSTFLAKSSSTNSAWRSTQELPALGLFSVACSSFAATAAKSGNGPASQPSFSANSR